MKIRNGFVSNSSSSSFVLIGRKIKLSDINPKKIKKEQYMFRSTHEGGEDTVYGYIPDAAMFDFLENHDDFYDEVYEVYAFKYDCNGIELSSIKIPKGAKAQIYSGTCEQWMIDDLDSVKEYMPEYFEGDDEEEEEEKYGTNISRHVVLQNTTGNHNKFYEMTDLGNGVFQARYGKIGDPGQIVTYYPISEWERIYREKINKGYELISGRFAL